MEKSLLHLEKSSKANPMDRHHSNSNRFSISAFILFILICFSMLHYHPSPAELLHNTKFWFFLSNALILIIAADSGAFSSSKQKYDIYEEYMKHNRARANASSNIKPTTATSTIDELPLSPEISVKDNLEKSLVIHTDNQELPESIPEEDVPSKNENPESFKENRTETSKEEETQVETSKEEETQVEAEDDAYETKVIRRSKSEEVIAVTGNDKKRVLSRSATGDLEPRSEENELWTMSDEELNRRVEEFIRFNRQMRLQETRRLVLVGDN